MATEKRLIDANALTRRFKVRGCFKKDMLGCMVAQIINTAPTVDAVEVVHGRWARKQIGKYTGTDEVVCSCCGYFIAVTCSDTGFKEAIKGMNYCPNCGAKMDGERKDNG